MKKFAIALAAAAAFSSPAFANETITFEDATGNCPSLFLGIAGDSVVGGIRYTLSTRDILRPGTLKMELGANEGDENHPVDYAHVIFTGQVRPEFASCKADKFFKGPMGTTVRRITIDGGRFRYVFKDTVNVISNASTYNGQAIVDFAEMM